MYSESILWIIEHRWAISKGYEVVLSPSDYIYLDYTQALGEPGAPWEGNENGPNSIQLIYNWEPVPANYTSAEKARVKRIEAAVWTEFIQSENYMDYMIYPRIAAVAEVSWSPKTQTYYWLANTKQQTLENQQ